MRRNGWHIVEEAGGVVMARRWPLRFDLSVAASLPPADPLRVAHQVRQDVWRALRDLRGFAPAVRVERMDGALRVTAGGQVDGALPRGAAEARIAAILEAPGNRARWIRWAS